MPIPLRQLLAGSLLSGLFQANALASGVSPYLPLNMSPEIERQIERLLILADRPVITRPIAAATVLDALPVACPKDEMLCRRVRRYLNRYVESTGVGHASAEVAASDGATTTLSNQHAMPSDSAWRVSAQAYWQPSAYGLVSVGGTAYEGEADPAGSMVSLGFDFAQLDVGYRDHWLSPFSESAMLISTQAKTLPSITLSNYAPLTRLGFQYQVFLAEMGYSDAIRYRDQLTSGEPRLAGLQLGIAPVPGWSLAVNRIMQYGGGERGGRSFSDFWNALVDPQGYDAISLDVTYDESFGNQAAAITSRFIFPGRTPFSVYFEYAGEDRSWEGNYRLGNAALSIGITFPRLFERFDLTYEASEWQNSWYVHTIYRDGLTEDGHVLGHWGADARQFGDRVGAQAHVLRLGWEPASGGLIQVRARTLANEDYASFPYQRAYDFAASYARNINGYTVGGEISTGRDVYGDSFSRLSGFFRFGDEWASAGDSSWTTESAEQETSGAEVFVDAGLNANRVRVIIDGVDVADGYDTATEIAPHAGFGARRAVSARQDLGVRAEIDDIQGDLLLAVRAIDYRYRFHNALSVTAFLGAARYDVATPAYGYYGGFGMQWRNVLPRVDLNIDARYADKVARDKLLPVESRRRRPDAFYDISSMSMYLSYRW